MAMTSPLRMIGEAGGDQGRGPLAGDASAAGRPPPGGRAAPLAGQAQPPAQARRPGPPSARGGATAATATAEEGGTIGCQHASRGPRPCDSASAVSASGSSSPPLRSFFARSSRRTGGPAAWWAGRRFRSGTCDGPQPWSRRSAPTSRAAAHDGLRGAILATRWAPTPPPARAVARGEGWRGAYVGLREGSAPDGHRARPGRPRARRPRGSILAAEREALGLEQPTAWTSHARCWSGGSSASCSWYLRCGWRPRCWLSEVRTLRCPATCSTYLRTMI